jgi:hypothetical protein
MKGNSPMQRRFAALIFLLVMLTISANAVLAGSLAFSGDFAGDPTMNVVTISTPNCASQGATLVRYDAFPFTVTQTGAYSFSAASTGGKGTLASIYIMDSGFNPAAALGNCLYGSNNGKPPATPTTLNNVNLTTGTDYFLVIFDDTFTQTTPGYNFSASGVGDIVFTGAAAAICLNPLPAGSVVYNVPLGAPTFYDASLDTQLSWNLPAGTWWISEFTGDFAKVWMSCGAQNFYIPANSVLR